MSNASGDIPAGSPQQRTLLRIPERPELLLEARIPPGARRRRGRRGAPGCERARKRFARRRIGKAIRPLARVVREVVELEAARPGLPDELPWRSAHGEQLRPCPVGGDAVRRLGERRTLRNGGERVSPRQPRRQRHAEERSERREHVDPLHLRGDVPARDAGARDHQRHADELVVEVDPVGEPAVLLELLAVVGEHHHHRRVAEPEAPEPVQEHGELAIPGADRRVVERAQVGEVLRARRGAARALRLGELVGLAGGRAGAHPRGRRRAEVGGGGVRVVRFHEVHVGEEAAAAHGAEVGDRPALPRAVPAELLEHLEPLDEVRPAGDERVGGHAERRDPGPRGFLGERAVRVGKKDWVARAEDAVALRVEPREVRGDGGGGPRRLRHRGIEDEPVCGEAIERRARARPGAVAAEAVGAERIDQHDEHARGGGRRALAIAPRLGDDPGIAPAGRAARRSAGMGRRGGEHDLHLARRRGAQRDAALEPAAIVLASGIDGAHEAFHPVDRHRKPHPACAGGRRRVALDARREVKHGPRRHVQPVDEARGHGRNQRRALAAGEVAERGLGREGPQVRARGGPEQIRGGVEAEPRRQRPRPGPPGKPPERARDRHEERGQPLHSTYPSARNWRTRSALGAGNPIFLADAHRTLAEEAARTGITTLGVSANPLVSRGTNFVQGFEVFQELGWDRARQRWASAATVAAAALADLRAVRGRRFLAYVHFMETHDPYTAAPDLRPPAPPGVSALAAAGKAHALAQAQRGGGAAASAEDLAYLRALYDAAIRSWDRQLAVLLDGLARLGLRDSTVVVVLADHGEEFGEHGWLTHRVHLYDELIRVPLVIAGPGIPRGRVQTQVQGIDVFPTLAALLGVPLPPGLPGRNALAAAPERPAFSETAYGIAADGAWTDLLAVRAPPWKLIWEPGASRFELYDLTQDPGERTNRFPDRPTSEALASTLATWRATAAPPPPSTGRDPGLEEKLRALGYAE